MFEIYIAQLMNKNDYYVVTQHKIFTIMKCDYYKYYKYINYSLNFFFFFIINKEGSIDSVTTGFLTQYGTYKYFKLDCTI